MSERFLLDTHALLWWTYQPHLLPTGVLRSIENSFEVFVSAVSAYEIALKHKKGLLDEAAPLAAEFEAQVERDSFLLLSITPSHARLAGIFDLRHRDPWDRILMAQAQLDDLVLLSKDDMFDAYGVERLW